MRIYIIISIELGMDPKKDRKLKSYYFDVVLQRYCDKCLLYW